LLRLAALPENLSNLKHAFEFITNLVMELEINLLSFNVFAVIIILTNLLMILFIPPFSVYHSPVLLALIEAKQIDCRHFDDILATVHPNRRFNP